MIAKPKEHGLFGRLDRDWKTIPFGEFATLQHGKDLTKSQFRNGPVPVGGSNGIIGYHDTAIVAGPGITVGRSGSAGMVTYYEEDFWPHNTSLYVKDFHGNDPLFTRYFFMAASQGESDRRSGVCPCRRICRPNSRVSCQRRSNWRMW